MIEEINLNQERQSICRAMICQFNYSEFDWEKSNGLYFLTHNSKIEEKVNEMLNIAKKNLVDIVVFPELSIPYKLIEIIQDWSREQGAIVVCGSHYHRNSDNKFISRCPVIIKGVVYFTEKLSPSPFEKSPIIGDGIIGGQKVLKFRNSFVGNFAILICSDYLDDNVKALLQINDLDFFCVPSFQKDSELYFRRMSIDCESSENGIFILYSNFLETIQGDGKSSVFGIMDNMYTQKLKESGYTDLNPDKKLLQFDTLSQYFVVELMINNKRPFVNRNIQSAPNFMVLSTSSTLESNDFEFVEKIANYDDRYKKIDDLFVKPLEYEDILESLDINNMVFIIGDPGVGKTYTAIRILKHYFELGYEPVWIPGLNKEDRETQSKFINGFIPSNKQILYFEDPFGRTNFERRDTLFQVFGPLLDRLKSKNSKLIVTSRREIFEKFTAESLLETDILQLTTDLNIRKPSYNSSQLHEIFDKLASVTCSWYDIYSFRKKVYDAINNGRIRTPLAIADLVYVSKEVKSLKILNEHISRRGHESIKVFALEILSSAISIKSILYVTFFCGGLGRQYVSDLHMKVIKRLTEMNLVVDSLSFNVDIRSQIGYRIEQLGGEKSNYRLSHPIYEEALTSLVFSNKICELIVKVIIEELIKKDGTIIYKIGAKYIFRFSEFSLWLLKYILENSSLIDNDGIRISYSQSLISIFYYTKNKEFFELACRFFSIDDLVYSINQDTRSWESLSKKLNLCRRYLYNSPIEFESSELKKINWNVVFGKQYMGSLSASKVAYILEIASTINARSINVFLKRHGVNFLRRIFLFANEFERKKILSLFENNIAIKNYQFYFESLKMLDHLPAKTTFRQVKRMIFSDKKIYGKIQVDLGAQRALKLRFKNLLPIGIINIECEFSRGATVGLFDEENNLFGVGIIEFSSFELAKIKGKKSFEASNILGYMHTSCAIRREHMIIFKKKKDCEMWSLVHL